MIGHKQLLWTDLKHIRLFLIPPGQPLPAGDFALRPLDGGEELRVDEATAAAFEVSEEQAKAHVQATLDEALKHASAAFAGFVNFAGLLGEQPERPAPTAQQPDIAAIAALLGSSPDELRRNPELIRSGARSLMREVQAALGDAAADDPAQQNAARDRLRFLRAGLRARGVDLGEGFEHLPEQFQLFARLGDEQTVRELAGKLRAFADGMDEEPEALGRRIDEFIADMERRFGGLVGETKAQRTARKQQEYRQSARDAIAASLRAHGITPLATGDDSEPSKHSGNV